MVKNVHRQVWLVNIMHLLRTKEVIEEFTNVKLRSEFLLLALGSIFGILNLVMQKIGGDFTNNLMLLGVSRAIDVCFHVCPCWRPLSVTAISEGMYYVKM